MIEDRESDNFLLAEYQEIYQEFRRVRQEGISRLNFFITLTTSIIAGLALLYQVGTSASHFLEYVAIGSLFFLLLIGGDIFNFLISRDSDTDANVRATARIRRYFANRSPIITEYLTWQIHDEPTPWIVQNTSGIRRTLQSILAMISALAMGLIVNLLVQQLEVVILAIILAFVGTIFILQQYAKKRYGAVYAIANSSIRFPRKNTKQEEEEE